MPSVLVAYASSHGQTARIAERIAGELRARRLEVDLYELRRMPRGLVIRRYDGVVLGSRVHLQMFPRRLRRFIEDHAPDLNAVPSAFYSVSLSAASPDTRARALAYVVTDRFTEETGWHPRLKEAFGGALPYSRYGFWLRVLMRRVGAQTGHGVDVTHDEQYTRWDDVRRFAESFADDLLGAQPAAPSLH